MSGSWHKPRHLACPGHSGRWWRLRAWQRQRHPAGRCADGAARSRHGASTTAAPARCSASIARDGWWRAIPLGVDRTGTLLSSMPGTVHGTRLDRPHHPPGCGRTAVTRYRCQHDSGTGTLQYRSPAAGMGSVQSRGEPTGGRTGTGTAHVPAITACTTAPARESCGRGGHIPGIGDGRQRHRHGPARSPATGTALSQARSAGGPTQYPYMQGKGIRRAGGGEGRDLTYVWGAKRRSGDPERGSESTPVETYRGMLTD